MADDPNIPDAVPDIQRSGSAIVRSQQEADEARASLARLHTKPKNEEVYWCMGCGFVENENDPRSCKYPFGMTLKFDPDEIEALGGDLTAYTGPCPVCKYMTLVPKSHVSGGQSINAQAHEQRKKEYTEQAEVFADVIGKKVVGSIFEGGVRDPEADQQEPVEGPPVDDLPDADDVDTSDMKARG